MTAPPSDAPSDLPNEAPRPVPRHDVSSYSALGRCGILSPDDRVELLDGMVVSMPPASPIGDGIVHHVQALLQRKLGPDVLVRSRCTFVAGPRSAPQPDVAVLPGRNGDYLGQHPTRAHLIVEVADQSTAQDRLTMAAIYARAGVAVYWIVNVRERSVECARMPDRVGRRYMQEAVATGADRLPLDAYPEAWIEARELFPDDTGR